MKVTRRRLAIALAAALVLACVAMVLREEWHTGVLPSPVRERMPAYWRTDLGVPAELRTLVRGLYRADIGLRGLSAHRLGNLGRDAAPAIPFLLALLAEEDPHASRAASGAGPNVVPAESLLRQVWTTIRDWFPRPTASSGARMNWLAFYPDAGAEAASALADVGEAAIDPLIAALADPLPLVRARAAWTLVSIQDPRSLAPLVALLQDPDPMVRARAAWALAVFPDEGSVEPLVAVLSNPQEKRDVRWQAAGALVAVGEPALPGLLRVLREADPIGRRVAARHLASWDGPQDPRVFAALLGALEAADAEVAADAILSLARPGDGRVVDPLLSALRHPSATVREHAAHGLGFVGDPKAVDALVTALEDADPAVRRAAADALGKLKDRRAVGPLCRALSDSEKQVRDEAAESLGEIADPRAVGPLITALEARQETPSGHDPLAYALRPLADPRAIPALLAAQTSAKYSDWVKEALAAMGPDAVAPLIQALRHEDRLTRKVAAETLGRIGDARAHDPLMAAVKDPESGVRREAALALGRIGGPGVFDLLLATARNPDPMDPDVRVAALEGLGLLKDPRAAEPLLAFLAAPMAPEAMDSAVRRAASGNPSGVLTPQDQAELAAKTNRDYPAYQIAVARALWHLRDPRTVKLHLDLLESLGTRPRDVYDPPRDLPEMGDAAIEPLVEAIDDSRDVVREIAVQVLARIRTPRARDVLRRSLPRVSDDLRKLAAVEVHNTIHQQKPPPDDPTASDLLVAILRTSQDRSARIKAIDALETLADRRAVEALRQVARDDPCHRIRRYAAEVADQLETGRPEKPLLERSPYAAEWEFDLRWVW